MTQQTQRTLAYAGIAAGALGVVSAAVLMAWPAQVAPGPVRYPFTTTQFTVVQLWFFVHHFGLVAVLAGLALSGATGPNRVFRGAAWAAAAGALALALAELNAIGYANADYKAANAGFMGTAYGITSTVIGLGALVAGIGVARARRWTGWHRWIPLAVGIAEFVVVTPGIFMGFTAGRLAIGFWMLLFALLGWSLLTESTRPATARRGWGGAEVRAEVRS